MLLDPIVDGLYLVRESIHYPGDYTLSVCNGKRNIVEHYRIIYNKNKLTIDEETYFDNLPALVEVFVLNFHVAAALRLLLNPYSYTETTNGYRIGLNT